ncbi:hypothetical protein WG906_05980 [Pedobacter sp. P351]|uniref:hypothetical protein n=1 Tax=Pedobacter superstes TaxID=3133441 RepID=UPI003097625E
MYSLVINNFKREQTMELKDFISDSIKQITDGLIEGHEYIQQKSPGAFAKDNSKSQKFADFEDPEIEARTCLIKR